MNQRMKVDPTILVDYKGQKFPVSQLPEEIRLEVETLDRLKQDILDKAYEAEKSQLAAQMKAIIINSMLQAHMQPKTEIAKVEENGTEITKSNGLPD